MAEKENWQFNKSALECHKYMLEYGIATDVTFTVTNDTSSASHGDDNSAFNNVTTFKAHK